MPDGEAAARPVRLLTFTTLYPNGQQPNHGVFVENRLRHVVESGEAVASVVAPVPWFPSRAKLFGQWARYAGVARQETRHGIAVDHPSYLVIPRIGMTAAPGLLFRAALAQVKAMMAIGFDFDVIDAHYFYPDGVAAVRLGESLGKPVVITARGSDITQIADFPRQRAMIRAAARRAAWMITVSADLRERLVDLGAYGDRITVLRNGIDTRMFHPVPPEDARRALGLTGPTLISVGLLIERKRHHLTIEAMRHLPGMGLVIAGEGPERPRLQALIERLGLGERVRLVGAVPHSDLAEHYSAAEVMVLASSREGWANVLLESMACGTPVVALRIGGNAEVVQEQAAGMIVDDATPEAIAAGVRAVLAGPPDRAATRAYAERFSWDETTRGQIEIFRKVASLPLPR